MKISNESKLYSLISEGILRYESSRCRKFTILSSLCNKQGNILPVFIFNKATTRFISIGNRPINYKQNIIVIIQPDFTQSLTHWLLMQNKSEKHFQSLF